MADSIRKCLDENDTIAELKLLLSASKDKVYVVVEGDDDVRMFKNLLGCKTYLVQSYQSKLGVEKMIHINFKKQPRVIGIRDKDYQNKPIDKRIFYCDFCCSEMMIVSNDDCFTRIYNAFCDTSIDAMKLRFICLQYLEYLSKLRCLNEKKKWNIKFDGISPNSLYDSDMSKMNLNIIEYLNKRNPNNIISKKRQDDVESLFQKNLNEKELLNITNGHDFINLFHWLGKVKNSINSVGNSFRASYGKIEFKQTKLYNNLLKFQHSNFLSIVD